MYFISLTPHAIKRRQQIMHGKCVMYATEFYETPFRTANRILFSMNSSLSWLSWTILSWQSGKKPLSLANDSIFIDNYTTNL